jgi:hypothetical protein
VKSLPDTIGQVTFNSNTVRMDIRSSAQALLSLSEDGSVFVFDPSYSRIRDLAPGKILLLDDVALRKVKSVTDWNGHVVVDTDPAALTDAIQEGRMKWNVPVRFGSHLGAMTLTPSGSSTWNANLAPWFKPTPVVYADSTGLQTSGEKNGWHYTLAAQPANNRLEISLGLSKEVKGLTVELHGKGYIENFETDTDIEIHNSQLSHFSFKNKDLKAEMNFDWSAVKEGTGPGGLKGDDALFKFPANFSAPMPIAGIPFVLEITEAVSFQPAFGEKREMGKGSFKVSYDGLGGFSMDQGTPAGEGNIQGTSEIGDVASVSMAPSGLILALAAPKVELKLGAESAYQMLKKSIPSSMAQDAMDGLLSTKLGAKVKDKFKTEANAYFSFTSVFYFVSSGPLGMVPCQKSVVTLFGKAGAKATFLGQGLGDKEIDLYKKEFKRVIPPSKVCDV